MDVATIDDLVALLKERPGLTCTAIGETLWCKNDGKLFSGRQYRQCYARPAGKLVKRAKNLGLVFEFYTLLTLPRGNRYIRVFYVTTKGLRAVEERE